MFFNTIFKPFSKIRKSFKKETTSLRQTNTNTTNSKDVERVTAQTESNSSKNGFNFYYKDGRRFQNETGISYVLPNDYDELDRVHQQHWMLKLVLKGNFHVPLKEQLKKGITVLDSGCGPATWTLDMAETYPNSKFYGVDASLVFPESIKPANVEFAVANIAKEILYPDNTFDFIYQRYLILGLTSEDWNNTLRELYRVLKPGGYIEFVESDAVEFIRSGPLISKSLNTMTKLLLGRKMAPLILYELKDRLKKTGFDHKDFCVEHLNLSKKTKIGKLVWDDYEQLLLSSRPILSLAIPEWTDEEVYKKYVEECAIECIEYDTICKTGYHCAIKPY